MKQYSFTDPDNEMYEIIIPSEVVKDIKISYIQSTFYWTVGLCGFIVGILIGIGI